MASDPVPTSGPASVVVVRTPARRVDVRGDDRVRYLEDVTSQRLVDVPVTHVRGTLHLDPHGTPLAMFDVAVLGDRLVLLVPTPELTDTVVEVLGGRTFLLDARFEATDHEVVAVRGHDVDAVVAAAGLTVVPDRCRLAGDVLVVHRVGGVDLVGPADAVAVAVDALRDAGAVDGDASDLDRWRVEAGVPAWAVEVAAPHLPEELGLLPTHVHLAKGCYPGQEAVARMWMLGRPRRRLAVVTPVATRLEPGWEAGAGRRAVTVTTVTPDGERALAFVPGDAAVGDAFSDDHGAGIEVAALIGAQADPPGADPAVTRRRDRPRA